MADTTQVVEKRIKPTVIRRRAQAEPQVAPPAEPTEEKGTTAKPASPPQRAAKAEALAKGPAATVPPTPPAVPKVAVPPVSSVPTPRSVASLIQPESAVAEAEKGGEESAKVKPKKAVKKLSKNDIEEALIQRVGGLKKIAQIADSGITRLERVFQPDRLAKGKKKILGRRQFKKTELTVPKASKRLIRIEEGISVGELAHRMGLKGGDLVKKLMEMGQMVTINQVIDHETASIVAHDFNFEVEDVTVTEESLFGGAQGKDENLVARAPIVTVMGHVDHGKTSLLDAIRSTNVTAKEAGGITQHIGAYSVATSKGEVTFIDTPGHEAFTAMRARGAKVTDIVVLVVAADDGVMPQTVEAIDHATAAKVPIVVAVNKMDRPEANLDRVKRTLAERGLSPEEWGGHTLYCPVSAKEKQGIDKLLEAIVLQAEVLELKADPNLQAEGVVIEAQLDRDRGPLATILVQKGTLKVGDVVVAGIHYGRVRRLMNERGQVVETAGPSRAVELIGLAGVPEAGDLFRVAPSEDDAREVAERRLAKSRLARAAQSSKLSLEQFYEQVQEGGVKELRLIVKTDVQGSVEAIKAALLKLTTAEVRVLVVHSAVGAITESDVNLAVASRAMILGFNVRPDEKGRTSAENQGIEIRNYSIIYEMLDDIRKAMVGLLAPIQKESYLGRAAVKQLFTISKIGTVAGCEVIDGKVARNARVRLLRDGAVVYQGKILALMRFKDEAREVAKGLECGISIENFQDIKAGDVIEAFLIEEIAATLSAPTSK